MDGAERYGEEEGKEEGRCSIGVEVLRGMEEEGESVRRKGGFRFMEGGEG